MNFTPVIQIFFHSFSSEPGTAFIPGLIPAGADLQSHDYEDVYGLFIAGLKIPGLGGADCKSAPAS